MVRKHRSERHVTPAVRANVAVPAITTRRRDIFDRAALTLVRGWFLVRKRRRGTVPGSAKNARLDGGKTAETHTTIDGRIGQMPRLSIRCDESPSAARKPWVAEDQIRHLKNRHFRSSLMRCVCCRNSVATRGARHAGQKTRSRARFTFGNYQGNVTDAKWRSEAELACSEIGIVTTRTSRERFIF
jgi:hypothetical protein